MARVVADEAGRIRIDGSRRQPGRGAYVHRVRECIDQMVKRGSLQRALKRRLVPTGVDDLTQRIAGNKGKDE